MFNVLGEAVREIETSAAAVVGGLLAVVTCKAWLLVGLGSLALLATTATFATGPAMAGWTLMVTISVAPFPRSGRLKRTLLPFCAAGAGLALIRVAPAGSVS